MKIWPGLFLILFAFPLSALACSFDTDCEVGSKCVKERGKLKGVCTGGMSPGNSNDQDPYYDPIKKGIGDTCSFDTECEIGLRCAKDGGSLYGVCEER